MTFKSIGLLLCLAHVALVTASEQSSSDTTAAVQKTGFIQELKQAAKIAGLSFGAASLYALLHDAVSAQLCSNENFTAYLHATAPYRGRGMDWSLVSYRDTGKYNALLLGGLAAATLTVVSRVGKRKKQTAKDLIKPAAVGMAVVGACSALSPYFCMTENFTEYYSKILTTISKEEITGIGHRLFARDAAYSAGIVAIAGCAAWIFSKRFLSYSEAEKAEQAELIKKLAAVKKA